LPGQGLQLVEQAREALRRRDPATALALLDQLDGPDAPVQVNLDRALGLRMLGRDGEALTALDKALLREPKHFLALLSRASILERLGRGPAAAAAYRAAIGVAPPEAALPQGAAQALAAGRVFVERANAQTAERLRAALKDVREGCTRADLERFDESLDIFAGVSKAFVQQPLLLHYPRLPAIPFLDRALFPWLERLEAATPMIRAELAALNDVALDGYAPYVQMPPGVPVDQWRELNHSRRWSSFFLWLNSERQGPACELCPGTAALLAQLPMTDQPGFAPTAMFSRLDARTRIPPHTGSTNTRLVVHLPLELPGPAWFRVGNVRRDWRTGEAWVFDDTIEHEAMNEADTPRTILIFDVWNPFLSEAERTLVSAMLTARKTIETET
jgi:aspartyl/asparaginyl beta-hydroxylase (cupin superfamily)